jgi:hypothetical protein
MNERALTKALEAFARRHRTTFETLGNRQTQLLELAAFAGVIQHYRSVGFRTHAVNPGAGSIFKVKLSTRGHPSDYSFVQCERDGEVVEIHSNVSVRGAHDAGIYCVDVAVVRPNTMPRSKTGPKWIALENRELITFCEVKKLVVYPMLLAQFVGIVHEIQPRFLGRRRRGFGRRGHLPPTLIALGQLSGNSSVIIEGFGTRRFHLEVASSYDLRLARVRKDTSATPFFMRT